MPLLALPDMVPGAVEKHADSIVRMGHDSFLFVIHVLLFTD